MSRFKDIIDSLRGVKTPSQTAVDMTIYQAQLEAAKEYLGKKYLFHPEYRSEDNPAHGFRGCYTLTKWNLERYEAGRTA